MTWLVNEYKKIKQDRNNGCDLFGLPDTLEEITSGIMQEELNMMFEEYVHTENSHNIIDYSRERYDKT